LGVGESEGGGAEVGPVDGNDGGGLEIGAGGGVVGGPSGDGAYGAVAGGATGIAGATGAIGVPAAGFVVHVIAVAPRASSTCGNAFGPIVGG
jgi:hypothetical protein